MYAVYYAIIDSTMKVRRKMVDTSGWLSSQKCLVPPDQIHASFRHKDDFAISASKQQPAGLPEYKESDLGSEENWKKYEKSDRRSESVADQCKAA